jgi:hypothetical protein
VLRRGPIFGGLGRRAPFVSEGERTAESDSSKTRVMTPIYVSDPSRNSDGSIRAPRFGEQAHRLMAILRDGQFHNLAGAMEGVDCVRAVSDLITRGYAFERVGRYFRVRRRESGERYQSTFEVLEGVDFRKIISRSVDTGRGVEAAFEGDFDPEGDVEVARGSVLRESVELSVPAADLMLPTAAIGSMTLAILARRGSGTSYFAMVLVEELVRKCEGLTVVVLDPAGVFWGLLSTSDGRPSDMSILLLGGPRGHLGLRASDGRRAAEVINEVRPHPVVFDLSEMAPSEQHEFCADLCERLLVLPHFPIHVVIDEADEFAPQQFGGVSRDQKRSRGCVERMVMRGRSRGIGSTCVSLRPAVLSKNVLSQVDALCLFCMVEPNDHRAVRGWLEDFDHKVTERQRAECLSQLPVLPVGSAYFLRGGEEATFRRFRVRRKATYDSSKTLVVGAVDSAVLSVPRGDVIEKARRILGHEVEEEVDGEESER